MEPLARQSMHSLACDSQSPSVTSTSKSCGPVPRPCQELTAVGRRSQWSSAASHADVLGSASVGTCSQASIRARTHPCARVPARARAAAVDDRKYSSISSGVHSHVHAEGSISLGGVR